MEKAFEFLSGHKDVAFATVEQDRPKIRVFQIMKQEGNISVRIAGEAIFDVDDATAQEIYAANPVLPRLYKSYTDLVYFRLPAVSLDYYDLPPDPPLQEHYEYGQK